MNTMQRTGLVLMLGVGLGASTEATSAKPITSPPAPETTGATHGSRWSSDGARTSAALAEGDRFYLFGGPGSMEGTFQTVEGMPDPQGWTSEDLTYQPPWWHVSDFNAENLGTHGPGNMAMWCGLEAENAPAYWFSPPGYGNNWLAVLQWRSGPLEDPSTGQTVDLDFFFNHETEAGYDFLRVQYETLSGWQQVYWIDGTNKDYQTGLFEPPGVQYGTVGAGSITYAGGDYGGENHDEIVLRLYVTSDGAYSDEDGIRPTTGGAAQVDDITVTYSDGTQGTIVDFTDFEGPGPFSWVPTQVPFAGDFAKIFLGLTDIDPCRTNRTAQFTFIDDGTPPNNAPGESTGGSTSPSWSYGTPGGWTTNDTGGIAGEGYFVQNQIISPPIPWDLPGTADDAPDMRTVIEYEVFDHHCCVTPTLFPRVRTSTDGGQTWSRWRTVASIGLQPTPPRYYDRTADISDRTDLNTTHVQIGFYFFDVARYAYPHQGVPAPFIDNVAVYKERSGPMIEVSRQNLLQDAFATLDSFDLGTQASRDALDVPLESARYNSYGNGNALLVDITPVGDDGTIQSLELHWVLDKNPLFEDAIRTMPAGSSTSVGTGPRGWDQVTGIVVIDPLSYASGYAFDFPNEDFLYPGDVFRYYVRTESETNAISFLPPDVGGFMDGDGYDRDFTVHALPTVLDASGTQPPILFIDYTGSAADGDLYRLAFGQNGLELGQDYDHYLVQDFYDLGFSGIGAQWHHGAHVSQLLGYSSLVLDTARQRFNEPYDHDLLADWHALAGDRLMIHFGDDLMSELPAGYRQTIAGVDVLDGDVRDDIDQQGAPRVLPLVSGFDLTFAANGVCDGRDFDAIQPRSPAAAGHGFEVVGDPGVPYTNVAASVVYDRLDGENDRIVDVTFPFGLDTVQDPHGKTAGASARASLLREALDVFAGQPGGPPVAVRGPSRPGIHALQCRPSPFNPRTSIRFALGQTGPCRVEVYDLRGQRVATLLDRPLAAGPHVIPWAGRDDADRPVASGVYVVSVESEGWTARTKAIVLK